jgi:tetratricopeptide (TPR) repeat protein
MFSLFGYHFLFGPPPKDRVDWGCALVSFGFWFTLPLFKSIFTYWRDRRQGELYGEPPGWGVFFLASVPVLVTSVGLWLIRPDGVGVFFVLGIVSVLLAIICFWAYGVFCFLEEVARRRRGWGVVFLGTGCLILTGLGYWLAPTAAVRAFHRGNAFADKKEYDKAIADYSEAIRLDPTYVAAFNNRGLAFADKEEYDKAIADYIEAIRLDPTYAWGYNNLAWVLATCPNDRVRDGNKAIELATKACELSKWQNAYHLGTLAAANAESRHFDEAVNWQQKAMKLRFPDWCILRGQRDAIVDIPDFIVSQRFGNLPAFKQECQRLKLYQEGKPYRADQQ